MNNSIIVKDKKIGHKEFSSIVHIDKLEDNRIGLQFSFNQTLCEMIKFEESELIELIKYLGESIGYKVNIKK
jgi:hypothetical protein